MNAAAGRATTLEAAARAQGREPSSRSTPKLLLVLEGGYPTRTVPPSQRLTTTAMTTKPIKRTL